MFQRSNAKLNLYRFQYVFIKLVLVFSIWLEAKIRPAFSVVSALDLLLQMNPILNSYEVYNVTSKSVLSYTLTRNGDKGMLFVF